MKRRYKPIYLLVFVVLVSGILDSGGSLSGQTLLKQKTPAYQLKGTKQLPVLKQTITFTPGGINYVPPLVRGDRDFGGNGPYINCSVIIAPDRNKEKLVCTVEMWARETGASRGTYAGGSTTQIVYTAPAGWTISQIITPTKSSKSYTDSNHDEDVFAMGNYELVRVFSFVGDTKGDEAGTKTRVSVTFNAVKVEITKPKIEAKTQSVAISPGARTFVPPHVRGDKDFGGHGPFVSCTVDFELHNLDTELICRIYMIARETKSDYTTARGNEQFTIYRAPAGKKIVKIDEGFHSEKEYTDTDHADDTFTVSIGPVQKFIFTGDTSGDEAGSRTKVNVFFRTLHIQLTDQS